GRSDTPAGDTSPATRNLGYDGRLAVHSDNSGALPEGRRTTASCEARARATAAAPMTVTPDQSASGVAPIRTTPRSSRNRTAATVVRIPPEAVEPSRRSMSSGRIDD